MKKSLVLLASQTRVLALAALAGCMDHARRTLMKTDAASSSSRSTARATRALALTGLSFCAATFAGCDIIDEAHYAPSSAGWGFAETGTGDFYAVNTYTALSCYSNGTLNGSLATDGVVFRQVTNLAAAYPAPPAPDSVWGMFELGTAYQANTASKLNMLVRLDDACTASSVAWLPSPPAGHDFWVYDIAVSADGHIYVLVDDTSGLDVYRIFHTTNNGATWANVAVAPAQQTALAGDCFQSTETGKARMSYDRYSHEVVLLACKEAIRYNADTLAYVGSRSLNINVAGTAGLNDFDSYAGSSLVSYRDSVTNVNQLAIVSPAGPIVTTRAGFFLNVQYRQPTKAAFDSNPWGARFMANGHDPTALGARVHRYRAQN